MRAQFVVRWCACLLGIVLAAGCSAPQKNPPAPTHASDRQIERRIEKAFNTDPTSAESRVEVRVRNGQVRLTGFVPSREQRDRLQQIAASTPGVVNVVNELALPVGRDPQGDGSRQGNAAVKPGV